jgi:hypothetical protein
MYVAGDRKGRPPKMVFLLLLRRHLLRVFRLRRIVFSLLLRWTIHGLLRLIALLVGLILLLCWLTVWLVGLVVGRLLWRLVVRLLWLLRLLRLLPRIAHIPAPGRARTSLRDGADDNGSKRDKQQNTNDREHYLEYEPGQAQAERNDERKQYGKDPGKKPKPSATVWSISISHLNSSFCRREQYIIRSHRCFQTLLKTFTHHTIRIE